MWKVKNTNILLKIFCLKNRPLIFHYFFVSRSVCCYFTIFCRKNLMIDKCIFLYVSILLEY